MSIYTSIPARSSPSPSHRHTARFGPDTYRDSLRWEDQLFNPDDVDDFTNECRQLIEGFLPGQGLLMFYGPAGEFKSALANFVCMCIAGTVSFLGRKTTKARILWIDLDQGRTRMKQRMRAFKKGLKVGSWVAIDILSLPDPTIDGTSDDHMKALSDLITFGAYDLVVIDNLKNLSLSIKDTSDDMAQVLFHLRTIAEHNDCAILIIHHMTKATKSNRPGDRIRGSSAIEAALDCAYAVERVGRKDIVRVTQTKARDAAIDPFMAEFLFTHIEGTKILKEAVFVPYKATAGFKSKRELSGANLTAFTILSEQYAASGSKSVDVREWRQAAIEAGISTSNNPDSQAKAFKRALEYLIDNQYVECIDDYARPITGQDNGQTNGRHCPVT